MKSILFTLAAFPLIAQPILNVDPVEATMDEVISIGASGLKPHEKAIFHAKLVDDSGTNWAAYAVVAADENGEVSLDKSVPIDGSYTEKDPMGLIWSMSPETGELALFRSYSNMMKVEVSLEVEGQIEQTQEVVRWKVSPEVERIPVRENGLVGTLFLPRSERGPHPAVITLSGSGGGLSEGRAQILASHGFATLALAYFNMENLPSTLKEIPLEYFEKGLDWMQKHPEIDAGRIGIWGVSRGGELSLLLGTLFPEQIHAIAAYVPSSVVHGSIEADDTPAWTYQGKQVLPNAPFEEPVFNSEEGKSPDRAIPLTPFFLKGMEDDLSAYQAASIPVEKIKCPILLVSGEDDQMWPSSLYGQQIVDRLIDKGSTISYTHLSYPGAGHFISPPYTPTTRSVELHPIAKLWFDFGGNPKDDAFARKDSWEKTLDFFEKILRTP